MNSLDTGPLMVLFIGGAAATWIAGIFLAKTTDIIDDRLGLGQAVGGMILLGIGGTLPEIAITVSAALSGHLSLAVGNLLGGIAIQTLIFVALDATSKRDKPLTSLTTNSTALFEGVLVIVLVLFAIGGGLLPETTSLGPVSPMSPTIVVGWLGGMLILNATRKNPAWVPANAPPPPAAEPPNQFKKSSSMMVGLVFLAAAAATLAAGVLLEQTSNQLANDFGLNGVIFGATILAAVTGLPELSTGIVAVQAGHVNLAMGDIFGGNVVQLSLFLVADLLANEPVLPTASGQSLWLAALGGVVTAVFVGGLLLRAQHKRFGLGLDSWLALGLYIGGVALLPAIPD